MSAPAAAQATVEIVPDLDPTAFKRALAKSLRQVADELDPPTLSAQREYRKRRFTIERNADGHYIVVDHDEKLGYSAGFGKGLAKRMRNELREDPKRAAEVWYAEPLDTYQWEAV